MSDQGCSALSARHFDDHDQSRWVLDRFSSFSSDFLFLIKFKVDKAQNTKFYCSGDEADTEDDPVQVEKALVHLDSNKIRKKQMEALRSQTSWRDFKALMSRYFARDEEPLYNKVVLLQSLFKSPEENCHHYLIRY